MNDIQCLHKIKDLRKGNTIKVPQKILQLLPMTNKHNIKNVQRLIVKYKKNGHDRNCRLQGDVYMDLPGSKMM